VRTVVATVEVRTPTVAAGAGRRAPAGRSGPEGSVPMDPQAVQSHHPRSARGRSEMGLHREATPPDPGKAPMPVVRPTGGERVPVERGRIGGSTTASVGRRVKRSRSGSEEGGVVEE
jgi:hypothetical protein